MEEAQKLEPRKQTLSEIIEQFRKVIHSIDDLEGEVTPELEEELTACEDQLTDKVDRCLWVAREAEAQAGVWAERAKTFADRAKVLKNQAARLEDYVLWAMTTAKVDKLKTLNFTASVAQNPLSVTVEDEAKFVEYYLKEGAYIVIGVTDPEKEHVMLDLEDLPRFLRIEYSVNKKDLLAALKAGDSDIQFARLVEDRVHLRVK
jgi:hypothetical protein